MVVYGIAVITEEIINQRVVSVEKQDVTDVARVKVPIKQVSDNPIDLNAIRYVTVKDQSEVN